MADLVETVIGGILQRERMQPSHHRTAGIPLHKADAADATGKQKALAAKQEKDPQLWKASKQFEAIFLQQMMSEMRSTVSKSEFMPHGYAEDVHASMMDEAMAQASTKHSSLGIANAIYRQLEAGNHAHEIPNPADKLNIGSDLTLEAQRHAR
ncbi:MAG: rod-binding protein [Mariprofundus sp.]